MAESRLKSSIKRKAIHNVILIGVGFMVLIVVLVMFGSSFLTWFSLFVEQSQGNNDTTTTTDQQNDSFVAPPTLNPVVNATNKPQVAVSGFGLKNQTIQLFVNDELVDKSSVTTDNKFHFSSVALKAGQNTIKVKAENDNKQSDFSNTVTISYLKN